MSKSLDDINLDPFPGGVPERDTTGEDSPAQQSLSVHEQLILEDIEDRKSDRELRKEFGEKAYKVVRKTLYGWACVLLVYVFFSMFGKEIFPIPVIIAITTAVTLNVFAAFLGVIRGLFPTHKAKKD